MPRLLALLAVLTLGAAACSDPIAPEMRAVAGSYRVRVPDAADATAYGTLHVTSTANGVVTEVNVAGTEIDLVLSADGTTTGRLFVPDAPDDGGGPSADFEVPLTG